MTDRCYDENVCVPLPKTIDMKHKSRFPPSRIQTSYPGAHPSSTTARPMKTIAVFKPAKTTPALPA